ncbi:pyridoxal phosphate-dependent transferase [Lactarius akahatsu]|uniref:Pyridoxal phosphate-dependent transferase n=1 Tax=Lactarius akahatsu TaxID=416441 RepID=A0AAD4LL87_9AGAM|nr:pyridoxal phosphate-dependent transferase [Lactarius akahatsu]
MASPSLRDSHDAVCAWFLGPKAENADYFMMPVETILNDVIQCRRNFAPEDKDIIDAEALSSPAFRKSMSKLRTTLTLLSMLLPQHCVPFYSPRYMAHMVTDVSMPATLGYLTGLMYNPNNVGAEGGPITHIIEHEVGQQLCDMLGFSQQGRPTAWGHITCDSSTHLHTARNLKFHSLALRRAAENEPSLVHVAAHFSIRLCTGKEKLFTECDTWELLNLTPEAANDFEKYFGIEQPPQYLCLRTMHYSWAKGTAITGTGSTNITRVPVDEQARIDCQALDTLIECVKHHREVYAIVVNMGTTEHGSADPLSEILALRRKYQQQGLWFLIHADAAWGGYFTYATYATADSVTLDPHKSGYTPFPAGALCYQDGRLRYMVTWNSPVIGFEDESSKMGVYDIEGSKPGAAPVAAWLGHEVIRLHSGGFGYLLGRSIFTSTKMYSHWVTMSLDHPNLLVVPFRMLPSELGSDTSTEHVDEERRYIRDVLLRRVQEELANDPKACVLMRQMGSDLVVNAFACDFRVDAVVNNNISEANHLNARIYSRLLFKSMSEKLDDQKVIIVSSILSQEDYGTCLTKFKQRIGLSGQEDLFVLANVSMSPFAVNFAPVLADAFREAAEEEVKV